MDLGLEGRACLVTGASRGIGRATARALTAEGARVLGVARSASGAEGLALDVTEPDAGERAVAECVDRFGRIDVLVNNAGIGEAAGDASDLAFHRRVMETNYFAPVAGTLAVLPGMRQRGSGVIVNVSSDSGRAPGPREVAYGASKAALSAFSESLAFQLEGSGVHLHVLYPGWVPTPMGQGAVDGGMPTPPRMVRRTEEQISQLLLSRMGRSKIDIDATLAARFAPVARLLFPGLYRRSLRKAAGI